MADYGEYCIVAEEQCVTVQKPQHQESSACCQRYRNGFTGVKGMVLRFCNWEFTIKSEGPRICSIDIKNTNNKVPNHPMVAEIVVWQWDQNNNHQQKVIKKILYNKNHSFPLVSSSLQCDVNFIIRILGKRKFVEDICRPLDFLSSDDAFTISVGQLTFVVSAKRMMKVSPVFRRMLTTEMLEKAERKMDVKDAEPDMYRAFLEVVDPDQNVHPNPTNVVGVLKLADFYEANLVKERCEAHLVNCVEMPLLERLHLADTYGLSKLKESILSIGSVNLRAFYKAHFDEFKLKKGRFSPELLEEITLRLCDSE